MTLPDTGAGAPAKDATLKPASLAAYTRAVSGRQQIVLVALALMVALLATAPLELQKRIIDQAIEPRDPDLLILLGGGYIGVVLAHKAVKFTLNVYRGMVSEDVLRNSRRRIYANNVRRHPAASGQPVSVVSEEVERIAGFVGEAFSDLVVNAGTVVLVVGYMLVVEPRLALASLVVLALQAMAVPLIQRRLNALTAERTDLKRELSDDVIGRVPGDQFERFLEGVRRNRVRLHLWKHFSKALVNGFNHLATAGVLVIGGWLVIEGQTSLGVVVAFVSGLERIVNPARKVVAVYQLYARTRVQYHQIGRWLTKDD